MTDEFDVVVVGGGNAGFSAAHSAVEQGARVLLLEKAPEAAAGGNSFYTAGAFRFAMDSIDEVADLLEPDERHADAVVPAYPASAFEADMRRVTGGRCDPVLTEVLVSRSADAVRWLATKGIRWRLMYERQSYLSDGKWVFSGGLFVGTVDGGKGLIAQHTQAALEAGVEIRYGAEVTALHRAERGVTYRDSDGAEHRVAAGAVVLSAGGFESDPQRRAEHLGEGWDRALVRGTPTNTGEVLELALAAGAAPHGDWGSCHSVAWDADGSPTGGNRELTNQLTRQSYPIGIVVNVNGDRFVDEGADFRNYTYAKYGREILHQPQGRAFQLFDAKTRPLLRKEEYDSRPIAGARADSLAELAAQLGIDAAGLQRTVDEFNESIVDRPFDPAVKDGRAARVDPPKSNWAQALDTAPYYGYAVGCGITFTFGGLHVDESARVLDTGGRPIEGFYAAGEMVGGLFSGNYPGGSGLTSGAVFGRLAGAGAGRSARRG
ncbi:tricarballylate dehydrogenase [Saccharopolyspora antimicrobica]|uniref:Tricarballylate dehydrogenase n=1 Tax=Saccharopolyspora antimicrobica TaxID=455193 RepID=A0A1I5E7P0_9PSEU|nr:FAD-dependent tricarballylate dehydrogenase TcuA [Saccharopolyspora antimicrobica]RKT86698.1 tricarballylate dehydrogenase [Saccharopolyspora antimicrobica]SFO07333.1 tricarballylate dehydrogenase [Saccharopolyspora antimicrobica]